MRRPRWLPRLHLRRQPCPECGAHVPETYCEVCGYDLIRQTRADVSFHKPPT
jgi:predicted amidophosphoribosyltransferase